MTIQNPASFGAILALIIVGTATTDSAAQTKPTTMIVVEATYAGASASVVADAVAAPIEQQVNGVEHVAHLISRCGNGRGRGWQKAGFVDASQPKPRRDAPQIALIRGIRLGS